ncbi:ClpB protein [invertebrate metagenome]|uniref:ClpB protein n=1 Tax=invertebrate metagenome TaxID=1711999 RepID=A0A484H9G5_9ZZZZ
MEFERYTDRSKGFIQSAQTLALQRDHQRFTPAHLLQVLLADRDGLAATLMSAAGGDPNRARETVEAELDGIPRVQGSGAGHLYLTPEIARVFDNAEQTASKAGDLFVTAEYLLLALALTPGTAVHRLLSESGLTPQALNQAIKQMRNGRLAHSPSAEDTYDALKKYARDVTAAARDGQLDPVIGRDEEIRRAIQVLSRRTKNNPVLIGEPGVGKTAIVEGLALRIVNSDVPESLKNKKLMALDLGALVAGAKFRGEFEERLRAVLNEVTAAAGDIVLFIDEMHNLVGAGRAEGSMDASNLLKPALARGELHCVGATTLDEYRKHVEKDAALARRFQPVFVGEPTVEDTISILRGLKEKYELHHGVHIADGALVTAATLSNRYISDRFLPDKAIDLVDEAASRLRMAVDSKPEALDELDRRILQWKIEREALKKENDLAAQERLGRLEDELIVLERESEEVTRAWKAEKEKLADATKIKEQLDQARTEVDIAMRNGDLQRASELRYGVIPTLEQTLQVAESQEGNGLVNEVVIPEHIANVVSRWTGIPVDRMLTGEREKLVRMEEHVSTRVVGQTEAVRAIAHAVRRGRAGLSDPNRPMGSFLFLGPTGVGKTELTKALAEFLFDNENAMIRIDMSEYMEKHAVARLIGAPPGYIGYEEGGSLTEAVRRRPYQVVLFDEVEKAHPDVFNVLLQVLDDGRLTDGQGRTVDFRNTLIVLTSNLGSEILARRHHESDSTVVREAVMEVVRGAFRPEFLNRLDEILLFHRLGLGEMSKIVNIQLSKLRQRLEARGIILTLDVSTYSWLAEAGYDPVYGARPLKRVIQRTLENPLAMHILDGHLKEGATVKASVVSGQLVLNCDTAALPQAEEKRPE